MCTAMSSECACSGAQSCPTPQAWASQMALVVKNPLANAGDLRDVGSKPESGRSPGRGHSNPLQYSWLENPMDRGAWYRGCSAQGHTEADMTEAIWHAQRWSQKAKVIPSPQYSSPSPIGVSKCSVLSRICLLHQRVLLTRTQILQFSGLSQN